MNEETVRAEIIDPILAKLGFRFGTKNYVERELRLLYPNIAIGHRSPKDLPVGFADYVCGVDGRRGSFAIEAKKGSAPISARDIEQAHTYASHPEVRADFFALCNGHELLVFETMREEAKSPLLSLKYQDIENRFYEVEALFAPENLVKNCTRTYDLGRPLAAGLGSEIRLGVGWIRTNQSEFDIDAHPTDPVYLLLKQQGLFDKLQSDLDEIRLYRQPITGGTIGRDNNGLMITEIELSSASDKLAHNLTTMNLHKISFYSRAADFEENELTIFETLRESSIPEGVEFYPGIRGDLERLSAGAEIALHYRAIGRLHHSSFVGLYSGLSVIRATGTPFPVPPFVLRHEGDFEIEIR